MIQVDANINPGNTGTGLAIPTRFVEPVLSRLAVEAGPDRDRRSAPRDVSRRAARGPGARGDSEAHAGRCEVLVEAGAGEAALYPDALYVEEGARMATERAAVFAAADVLVQVRAPSTACRSSTWTRPAP